MSELLIYGHTPQMLARKITAKMHEGLGQGHR